MTTPPPGEQPDDQGQAQWSTGDEPGGRGSPPPYGNPPAYGGAATYGSPSGSPSYGTGAGPRNGLGTAALVLGIIGLICSLLLGWVLIGIPFGIILGILAVIMGVIGRRRFRGGEATNGGAALSGVILGVIAIIAALAIGGIYAFILTRGGVGNYVECVAKANGNHQQTQQCEQRFRDRRGH